MFMVHLCIYLCMYLPQAVALPPLLGIQWDLFQHTQLVEEGELEPAVVTCGVVVLHFRAIHLQPGQVSRGKTGPILSRIAHNRCLLRSELGLGYRNPADQLVSAYYLYL